MSVILPTFNRATWVKEAVASVLEQRGISFELVVVDDGSSDGTADMLQREFADQLRLLSTANHGVSAARNLGVRESRGSLIAFLDSDDLWLPGKLQAQIEYLRAHPSVEICQTEELWVRDGKRVNPCAHHRKPSGWIFEPSLQRCLVSPSAVLMTRVLFDRVGGFDESLSACEDYDLWLRVACKNQVGLVTQPLVVKRGGHADQLSRQHWGMDRFRVAALTKLLAQTALSTDQRQATLEVLHEKCRVLAQGAAKRGRQDDVDRYLSLTRIAA